MSNKAICTDGTTLAQLVKNTIAEFVCYRDGDLWYRVVCEQNLLLPSIDQIQPQLCDGRIVLFEFPVPISDTGSGIFERIHKSITLMRWIRKHYDSEKQLWAS